jgi:lipopolysaccharide transport system permease protein
MPVAYEILRTEVHPAERRVQLEFRVVNRGVEYFRASDGLSIGWQVFDPASGRFYAEGEWRKMERDLAPGDSERCEVEVVLPGDEGEYSVYISPRTGDGWFYSLGEKYLEAAASVTDGVAAWHGARVTTLGERARRGGLGQIRAAIAEVSASIWRNRGLVASMTRRDLASRYRGSFGDAYWAVFHPVLLMATYFFVFGVVLQTRFPGGPGRTGYAFYLLCGMLPWLGFSEAVARAPSSLLDNRHLVKKVVFPLELLSVNHVLAALFTQLVAAGVFVLAIKFWRGGPTPLVQWIPVLLVPQVLFTIGLAWAFAALGVFFRDLVQIIGPILTLWFFLTPICYPESSLPAAAFSILRKNPVYMLVRGWRTVLLEGSAPPDKSLLGAALAGIAMFLIGLSLFRRLRRSFADVI